jgi:hypothetical protein
LLICHRPRSTEPEFWPVADGLQLDSAMATATATTICRTLPTAVLTLAVYEKPALAATLAHSVAAAEAAGARSVTAAPAEAEAEVAPSGTINTAASAATGSRIGRSRSPPSHHRNLLLSGSDRTHAS